MDPENKTTEKTIIDENLDYVLGMYDLYQNDQEITDALKLKGLDDKIIQQVLARIKQPAYEKRKGQAKRMIITGSILVIVLLSITYILKQLPGSESILNGKETGEGMLRITFRIYSDIYFYIIILAVIQVGYGIFSFYKYKKLLNAI